MEIPGTSTTQRILTKEPSLAIDKLQNGQFLQVKIVDQVSNKSNVIIRLGNQLLQVRSDIPVTIGQTIKVLVEKTPSEIILKVKPPIEPSNLINTTLRQLLPKQTPVNNFQQPLSQVFASIDKQIIKSATSQSKELAPQLIQLKRLAKNILQALPNQANITTSEGIKNAIKNSGAFLEPKLLQILSENKATLNSNADNSKVAQKLSIDHLSTMGLNTDSSRVDVKANLIKLIQLLSVWPKNIPTHSQQIAGHQKQQNTLNPSTGSLKLTTVLPSSSPLQLLDQQIKELINKTEGALSKITLNQLSSSNSDNSSARQTWQIEIPFLNQQATESIYLKIEQKEAPHKKANELDPQWVVSLEMMPPKLGLIKNKLTLSNDQISSHFWAEEAETRNLIDGHLSSFKEQLNRATNLKVDSIQLQDGLGPAIQNNPLSESIFNEKA